MNLGPMRDSLYQQSLRLLEFDEVLQRVGQHADTEAGQRAVRALLPFTDCETVNTRLREVQEATRLEEQLLSCPLRGARSLDAALGRAVRGAVLEPDLLLDVAGTVRVATRVRRFLDERATLCPLLHTHSQALTLHDALATAIESCIDQDATVRSTASHELQQVRELRSSLEARIQNRLQTLLRQASIARMLQEPYVTLRGDRYVLPVRQEYRSEFPGLVLDTSSSGATVFMEPWELVDMGNDLRAALAAEAREIERILQALTDQVGAHAASLTANQEVLALLDSRGAAARYGLAERALLLEVEDTAGLDLRGARHPLLGERAVPIDIRLGAPERLLVITGPNTGGKTVAIKTLGLLATMAMAGLPVPVAEGSRVGFLDAVFADIGDEQSLQQNLSTFSGHMRQVQAILEHAGSHTLVLLDEAGAGTDPREGTSLFVAILEHLYGAHSLVALTTHHSELKTFAATFPGAVNAAVEFDPATLQPTFRILMGQPGRSCALEIATSLGLPSAVIDRARDLLGQEHVSADSLAALLMEERAELRRQLQAAEQAAARALEQQAFAEALAQEGLTQRQETLNRARGEIAELIDTVRTELKSLVRETRSQLQSLSDPTPGRGVDRLEQRAQDGLKALGLVAQECLDTLAPGPASAPSSKPEVADKTVYKVGDSVVHKTLGQVGQIVETERNGELRVRLGALVTTVAAADLAPATRSTRQALKEASRGHGGELRTSNRSNSASTSTNRAGTPISPKATPPPTSPAGTRGFAGSATSSSLLQGRSDAALMTAALERMTRLSTRLSLLGRRAEQASYELERYLDGLAGSGVEQVTIVHGKGTGVLQKVVWEVLGAHPTISSFRYGNPEEGGWGVTVVTLQ